MDGHPDDVLFLDEAAEVLRVSPTSLYQLARRGKIGAVKRLGKWRFTRAELTRWMRESDAAEKARGRAAAAPEKGTSASERTDRTNTAYPWERTPAGER